MFRIEIVHGTTPGPRAQGRPKVSWLDNIKAWTELSVAQLIRNVENRQKWRKTYTMPPTLESRMAED